MKVGVGRCIWCGVMYYSMNIERCTVDSGKCYVELLKGLGLKG